jgi:hypothetical protein
MSEAEQEMIKALHEIRDLLRNTPNKPHGAVITCPKCKGLGNGPLGYCIKCQDKGCIYVEVRK